MSVMITDDLWFCVDCLFAHANGDPPEDPEREAEVEAGFEAFAAEHQFVTMNSGVEGGDLEFSWSDCDCCGSSLGGSRHRFALFGKDKDGN